MDNYAPNSHRSKDPKQAEQKPRFTKIISGKATTKKKNPLLSAIVQEDAGSMKSYILMDVVVPGIKKAIMEIVSMALGEPYNRSNTLGNTVSSLRVPFRAYDAMNNYSSRPTTAAARTRGVYDYGDVTLASRGEAEAVLAQMDSAISQYGVVSVADLYDMVGAESAYTDFKYGWTDLRMAQAVRTFNGQYQLSLPRALPID